MSSRRVLVPLVFLLASNVISAQPPANTDEKILQAAGIAADGPAVLKFIHSLVPGAGEPEAVAPLVRSLGSEDFFEREEAVKKLIALGAKALPQLRQALKEKDRELAARAEKCLKTIEGGPGIDVHGAALRLLAKLKPAGSAAAVLDYLPFAADQRVADEAARALEEVAQVEGKLDPVVLKATQDKMGVRRAAAAQALAKAGRDHLPELRKMLADPDATVRLRVGLGLVPLKEKQAVPVLINLLDKLPAPQLGSVYEILFRLAGDQAPVLNRTTPELERDAWMAWWKKNEAKIDLARLTEVARLMGRTLVVCMGEGFVQEMDEKGKVLWKIEKLLSPMSAQIVGDDRVLIVEYRGNKVSERTFDGKTVWEYRGAFPVSAQRLPGGRTFVALRNRVVELDQAGKQVDAKLLTGNIIMAARRLPSGHTVCLTSTGAVVRLDADGKEVQRTVVGFGFDFGTGFDVTLGGRVLAPQPRNDKILELDAQGKVVREWKYPGVSSVQRLPNGNLLVASPSQRRVVELNERGEAVWEMNVEGGPQRASKR